MEAALRIAGQTIETADDVQRICDEGWLESQQVEFKREVGDGSKIAKEVVALANHLGGHVVIGIDESDEAPARAARIATIANAGDAASRLERQLRDKIDPPIRGLVVHPIGTAADGAGVIIIEVPQSLFGPHRSGHDWRVYQRSGTESRPLTMTEIHRLVLAFEKREDRVEKRFQTLRAPPANLLHEFSGLFWFRVAGVPLGDLTIDLALFPTPWFAPCEVRSAGKVRRSRLDQEFGEFRPSLRSRISRLDRPTAVRTIILQEDGSAQFHYAVPRTQHAFASAVSMLATIYSLLSLQDEIASRADYPGGEFGIEIEASWAGDCELELLNTDLRGTGYRIGDVTNAIRCPPYRFQTGGDKQELIQRYWRDFWHSLQREPVEQIDTIGAPKA